MKVFAIKMNDAFRDNPLDQKVQEKRTLLGKLLLNYVLKKYYQVPPNLLKFKRNRYGKPFLQDYNLYFNISHSGSLVICAVDYYEIGVDVEKVVPRKLCSLISLFSNKEQNYLMEMAQEEQLIGFYKIWTCKESYIKALGVSLNKEILKNLDIIGDVDSTSRLNGFYLKTFQLDEKYIISLCSKQKDFKPKDLIFLQQKMLL